MASEIFALFGSIGLKGSKDVTSELAQVDKAGAKTGANMDKNSQQTGRSATSLAGRVGQTYTNMAGHVSKFAQSSAQNLGRVGANMQKTGQSMMQFGSVGKVALGAVGISAGGMGIAVASGMKRLDSLDKANLTFKAFNAAGDKSFGDVTKAAERMTKGTTMSVSEFGKKVDEYVGKGVPKSAAIATTSLNAFVSGTSVGMTEAANATARFNSVGMDLSKSTDTFKDMTKVLAGTGNATKESIDSASLAISQMAGKGKLDMGNMLQLMNTMPEALNMVSKSTGISSEEIQDAISSGKVTYEDFAKAMQERATEVDKLFEKQGGVMTQTGITFEGAIGRVRASIAKFGADILENIGKEDITKAIGDISVKMNEMSKVAAPLIADVVRFGVEAFNMIKPFVPMIASFVAASAGMYAMGSVLDKVGGLFTVFSRNPILTMLTLLAALFIKNYTQSETFRNTVNGLVSVFGNVMTILSPVINLLGSFVGWLANGGGAATVLRTGLMAAVGAFTAFMAIGKLVAMIQGFKTAIMASTAVTKTWELATKAAAVAQKLFNLAMNANPVMKIITVITALVGVLTWFFTQTETGKKAWTDFVGVVQGIWNGLKDFFTGLWDGIVGIFNAAVGFVGDILSSKWGQILLFIINPFMGIINAVIQNWDAIKQAFNTAVGAISDFMQSSWDVIKSIVETVMNAIKSVIDTVWNNINTVITTTMNVIKSVVTTVWNVMKTVITTVANAIKSVVDKVWNGIKSTTTSVFNAVKAVITTVWNAIKSVITNVVNGVKSVVTSVWNAIKNTTSNVFNAVKSVVTSVWNAIKGAVEKPVNAIKSAVSNGWNAVKTTTSNLFNGVKNTVTSIWNGIWDTIKGVVDKIKGAFNFNLKFPKVEIPHIPMPHFKMSGSFNPLKGQIPKVGIDWYAKGGIMTKPTIFGMNGNTMMGGGEAGKEAVLPLNDKTLGGIGAGIADQMKGNNQSTGEATTVFSGDMVFNVYGVDGIDEKSSSKFADEVIEKITRKQNARSRTIGGFA
ncbi:Putative phage tail tape measure protein [Weissella ceti]|uniref:tape measure protein n=1 Tax=Weissella ceti TaxID=759620 RepID=UPI0004F665C4|nr:tape measure protein [Weissella ceti]AIM64199.1 Putative phage tail tape measure protein [Weissella ceti]